MIARAVFLVMPVRIFCGALGSELSVLGARVRFSPSCWEGSGLVNSCLLIPTRRRRPIYRDCSVLLISTPTRLLGYRPAFASGCAVIKCTWQHVTSVAQ